jgi:hypothetical protein
VIESDTGNEIFRCCAILNRRSIASVGMLSVSRLRGRRFSEHPNSKECGAFCLEEGARDKSSHSGQYCSVI